MQGPAFRPELIAPARLNPFSGVGRLGSKTTITEVVTDKPISRARYTPGHGATAVNFMSGRSAGSHAHWFLSELHPGDDVLDVGCGPGSITLGLAEVASPGRVVGVDLSADQFDATRAVAEARGLSVVFETASAHALPFADASFDAAFSHALLEHLSDPVAALGEMRRVIRGGGCVGVASPDWGGFIVTPHSNALDAAIERYTKLQRGNGGNVLAGRHLPQWVLAAGFKELSMGAWYERYESNHRIGEYLAAQLDSVDVDAAATWRRWAQSPGAMFCQAWVWVVGRAA
jgi:SAM-dependent methyltransferase